MRVIDSRTRASTNQTKEKKLSNERERKNCTLHGNHFQVKGLRARAANYCLRAPLSLGLDGWNVPPGVSVYRCVRASELRQRRCFAFFRYVPPSLSSSRQW